MIKMRKIIIYILGFVLICFAIPIIFTNRTEIGEKNIALEENIVKSDNTDNQQPVEQPVEQPIEQQTEQQTDTKYGTVRVLHASSGEVEELAMDDYLLRGCISGDASKL